MDKKYKTINKHTNKTTVSDTRWTHKMKGSYQFSHVKGTIGRILNKHNIRTIFKPLKKIGQSLRNPKDQIPPHSSAEVYKISCSCTSIHWKNWENGQPPDIRTPTWCLVKTHHAISIIRTQHRNRTNTVW